MPSAAEPKTIYLKDYAPPTHLISNTNLCFELGEEETLVTSRLRMRKNPASKTNGTILVLNGNTNFAALLGIRLDGKALAPHEYELTQDTLTLNNLPASFELEIKTRLQPQLNTELEGLYKSGKGNKAKFCTQCEAEGFRNITYYLDRPDVMAEFTTEIIADSTRYPHLLSNGNLVEQRTLPDGRHIAKWHDPYPKPCYLFALVAGDMDVLEDRFTTMSGKNVALKLYVDKGDLDKTEHAMNSIKKSMAWDEVRFGREYDLDVFQVVAVHDFNMGAMENKGLNIFNAAAVLANEQTATDAEYYYIESVIAHEYFHNWSGNRVTCRDWFQLSLKEGFTVFRDQEFSGETHSPTLQRIGDVATLRARQFPEDNSPMAHPIRPAQFIEINNFYTTTVYEKGAEVIRMIQTLIGKDAFRKGADLYFSTYDGQAVTTEDFVKCMATVSGKDLSQFERTWYNQAGTPTLTISDNYDAHTRQYTLHVVQTTPPTPNQPNKEPFHIPLRVGLIDSTGKDMPLNLAEDDDVLSVTQAEQEFIFEHVRERPIPSLLRNFSAPVKIVYGYTREQLAFLMKHDSDGFNRWEAGQKLALGVLQDMISRIQENTDVTIDPLLTESLRKVLTDTSLDKMMVAKMMALPPESYLEEMTIGLVDPIAIHSARERLRLHLGQTLASELDFIYHANQSNAPYRFTTEAMAQRRLKNMAMDYLAAAGNISFAKAQFAAQANMTDVSPALTAIVNSDDDAARTEALAAFYAKWKHDPLVVNEWFSTQATSEKCCTTQDIRILMQHELFDIKEPDKVRSVLGAFARANINFHANDGSGYRFFADEIIAYDKVNRQVAARIVHPLTKWHMYGEPRATQMRTQLERIKAAPNLSNNVMEIASKSLSFTQRSKH